MERLSALDTSFLQLETAAAHMHVGWRSHLEMRGDEGLDVGRLSAQIERRLPSIPRFVQRVAWPSPLLDPTWVEDQAFDVRAHVKVVRGGGPLTQTQASRRFNEFLGTQLDRRRPLWELLVAPRTQAGGAAIVGKVHHAMVDGLAAVELGMLLFDADPDAPELEPPLPRAPDQSQAPGATRLVAAAAADTALEQFRLARATVRAGLAPRRTARLADSMRRASFSLAQDLVARPAPATMLNVAIGPRRVVHTARVPVERLAAIKKRAGVKLNDVVLAAAGDALRELAAVSGRPLGELRAMVPVSVRGEERAAAGNKIAFAFVNLPLGERHAGRRLELIAERMGTIKRDGSIGGSDALLRSLSGLPAPLRAQIARTAAGPRVYNLVISNVIGPPIPLFAAGARVREIYPVIPLSECHALALGVLTYDQHLHFAWHADPDALPTARRLVPLLERALRALERDT